MKLVIMATMITVIIIHSPTSWKFEFTNRLISLQQKRCEVRRLLDPQQSANCRCQSERHAPLRHSCICENRLGEARKSSFVPQQGVNRRCLLFSISDIWFNKACISFLPVPAMFVRALRSAAVRSVNRLLTAADAAPPSCGGGGGDGGVTGMLPAVVDAD